ncbi:MAG: hypothetical protein HFF35_10695, partial [Oscillospiraceae bacterium]|nr:hypothetical protein [Oscillospiraceae bacterium]
ITMKKRFLASLLALGMLLTMVTGAAWAADGDGANEAKIGSTEYPTLQEAIQAAQAGGTITLLKDVSAQDGATWENVNIDLAGHTITVPTGKNLVITGGTFTSNGYNFLNIEGTANISGGTFKSTLKATSDNGDGKSIVKVQAGGTLNMSGGKIDASETGNGENGMYGLSLFTGAKVNLSNNAEIIGSYAAIGMNNLEATPALELKITGGTYSITNVINTEQFNAVVYLPADANVTISGGTFSTPNETSSDGGPYVFSIPYSNINGDLDITGGTFSSSSTIFRTQAQTTPGGGNGNGMTPVISGGKFTETPATAGDYSFKQYVDSQYEINANGEIVEKDTTPAIGDLTVTASRNAGGKVEVSVTEAPVTGSSRHYKLFTTMQTKPTNDTFTEADWTPLPNEAISAEATNTHIVVIEAKDGKITKWACVAIGAYTPPTTDPKPAEGLVVTAKKDSDGKITVTVTGETSGNKLHYLLGDSSLAALKVGEALPGAWKELKDKTFTPDSADKNKTYIAIAETKDGKVTKWGKGEIKAASTPGGKPDELTLSPVSGGLGKKVSVEIGGGHWLTIRVEKGTSVALSSIQAPSGSGKTKVTFSAPSGSKVKVWETEKEITFGSNGSVSADIIAVGEITL